MVRLISTENSRESALKNNLTSFAPDGSAIATTGSLEVLNELLSSGLEYTKATNMQKGEDVISITPDILRRKTKRDNLFRRALSKLV